MSHTLPERFFDHSVHLLVIHDSDLHRIEMARLSLRAISDLVAIDAPRDCRVNLDRDQLAFLLDTIADKLDDIPEIMLNQVVQSRAQLSNPTEGA